MHGASLHLAFRGIFPPMGELILNLHFSGLIAQRNDVRLPGSNGTIKLVPVGFAIKNENRRVAKLDITRMESHQIGTLGKWK